MACNSTDNIGPQIAGAPMQQAQQSPSAQQSPQPTSDGARRITAEELHALWEKDKVLIIDLHPKVSGISYQNDRFMPRPGFERKREFEFLRDEVNRFEAVRKLIEKSAQNE